MFKNLSLQYKLLLVALLLAPTLFLGATFLVRSTTTAVIGAVSNTDSLTCIVGPDIVEINQCVTWTNDGSWAALIPYGLLIIEVLLAVALFILLRNSARLLLLTKLSLATAAILISIVAMFAINTFAVPHSQKSIVGATKQNGVYVVDKEPALGYGPENTELFLLFSLAPALGLIGGIAGIAASDRQKYAGMSKEKLFQ